jgi:3-phosphoshikimate 1-carboxyvinyltransferase
MRFLTAFLASIPGLDVELVGSARMHERPIGDLVQALQSFGANIEYLGKTLCPPLRIRGKALSCKEKTFISGTTSSQFLTSLLLCAPRIENFEIFVQGELTSRSYVDMTLQTLAQAGVPVQEVSPGHFKKIKDAALPGFTLPIEGDASGASYFFGLAALSGGEMTVKNLSSDSLQGDARFPNILARMGCEISSGGAGKDAWITVKGPGELVGCDADMTLMPDTAQTLAVLAAHAKGKSVLTGLHTLKSKETDRIEALASELSKFGCQLEKSAEHVKILGAGRLAAPRGPVRIASYDDHRMAMSFAMLGAVLPDVWIENPAVVSKSFPEFWDFVKELGIGVHEQESEEV